MVTTKTMSGHLGRHFSQGNLSVLTTRIVQLHTASPQPHKKRHQTASTANPKIDFLALEAKWQAKWDNRGAHVPRDVSVWGNQTPSLSPFYFRHLRKPTTILETLEWHYGRIGARTVNKEHTVFDRILQLSRPEYADFGTHIRRYGVDVIRTSLVFCGQTVEDTDIDEAEIEQTRQWFESIWKAIALAHDSYIITQRCPDSPNVPEALYEPGLESWLGYIGREHLQWVQVPPEEPEVSGLSTDGDEYRLWLIAQRAILAFTAPITVRNSVRTTKSRLMRLTKAMTAYDDAFTVSCDMHYYSARILLSLLAPSAPSFAEECWVLLHYGCQDSNSDGSESRYGLNEDEIEEIVKETEDDLGRHHLPRQGLPDTLQSIFDQPFPVTKRGVALRIKDPPATLINEHTGL
ncbi:hypothetical protein GGR58DRAFT_309773 [Xylaria digitata]|nr:hypothetical protein GGR58DRAFT_309773 [Xylaria digitata]